MEWVVGGTLAALLLSNLVFLFISIRVRTFAKYEREGRVFVRIVLHNQKPVYGWIMKNQLNSIGSERAFDKVQISNRKVTYIVVSGIVSVERVLLRSILLRSKE